MKFTRRRPHRDAEDGCCEIIRPQKLYELREALVGTGLLTIAYYGYGEIYLELKPISDANVIKGLSKAWKDSQPDSPTSRHEEGGYIVRNPDGTLGTES